ncbi:MAG: hypothetical protein IKU18_00015 [Bacteroidales bacterium]|nr:hypothetical protein [Bacteroidales bacterium]
MKKIILFFSVLCILFIISSCDTENKQIVYPIKQNVFFPIPDDSDAIDLGLSVKWAPYNIGASTPEDYGNYYAWGETDFKESYTPDNYITPQPNNNGDIIASQYDVATTVWRNGWRLPSKNEIDELNSRCSKEECMIGDVRGLKYTGPNGNSIFLPAAGYVTNVKLNSADIKGYYTNGSGKASLSPYFSDSLPKYAGISVRPVIDIAYNFEIDSIKPRTDYFYPLMHNDTLNIVFCGYGYIGTENFPEYIEEYGLAIYRNNELYSDFNADNGLSMIRIESPVSYLETTTTQSGAKVYNTSKCWSAGVYYIKKDYNGNKVKLYGTSRIPIDFNYYSNSIEIQNIQADPTKTEYYRINDEKLLQFNLSGKVKIDTLDASVRDYGVVIYKNDKVFTYVSANKITGNFEYDFFPEYSTMNISKNNLGEYTASTLGQWKIGTFIVRRNSDNFNNFYEFQDNIVPLELTYTVKPSLTIESFTYDKPEYISAPGIVMSHLNFKLSVVGGFFMKGFNVDANEHISLSNDPLMNNQILSFSKLFNLSYLHNNMGYLNCDDVFEIKSADILSYTEKERGKQISRGSSMLINTNIEFDNSIISTQILNYTLLHNGVLTVELIDL